jgi:predicted ATP-dependent serine protease
MWWVGCEFQSQLQTWRLRLPSHLPCVIYPMRADAVLIGEVGLSGELRWVGQMSARLREAANLGFKTAIVPRRVRRSEKFPEGIEIVEARSLRRP